MQKCIFRALVFVFVLFYGANSGLAVSTSVQTNPLSLKGKCNGCAFYSSDQIGCLKLSFCQFKSNMCQPVASCDVIKNVTHCTTARTQMLGLNCRWSYFSNKCIDISSTSCASIPGNSKTNCSNSGCGYLTGSYCSYPPKVTSCTSIKDGSCGLFQAEGQSCQKNSTGGCQLFITDCATQQVVPQSNSSSMIPSAKLFTCSKCGLYGANQTSCKSQGYCQFMNGNCTPVTNCSSINDTQSCYFARVYGTGLNCLWNTNFNKCVSLSNTQCGSIAGNSSQICSYYGCGYMNGSYCSNPTNVTSCAAQTKMSGCFQYQAQNQLCYPINSTNCQPFGFSCSNQTFSQITNRTSLIPKVQQYICNGCSSGKNQSTCVSTGYCQWMNNKCTPVTSCSQITNSNYCAIARASLTGLNCYWDSLITNKCISLSSVPCNQIFTNSISSCSLFGCGYEQGYFCSDPPIQTISSCTSIKNGACFLYQTNGAICIPTSTGSCYSATLTC